MNRRIRAWLNSRPAAVRGALVVLAAFGATALVLSAAQVGIANSSAILPEPSAPVRVFSVFSGDGQSPTQPRNLKAVNGTSSPEVAKLDWDASTDDRGVAAYIVTMSDSPDGTFRKVATAYSTSWTMKGGAPGGDLYFAVTALDQAGNRSQAATAGPVFAEWGRSPHTDTSVSNQTCDSCHRLHAANGPTLMASAATQTATAPQNEVETCVACHSGSGAANVASGTANSFNLGSGHTLEATASAKADLTNSCTSCHDPHADPANKQMLLAGTINKKAISTDGPEVCMACHEDPADWYGADYPKPSAPKRDASGYPVAGTWLGTAAWESTSSAHGQLGETTRTALSGASITRQKGDCQYCHAAHRGPNAYDGLIATYVAPTDKTLSSDLTQGTYATLCFDCHNSKGPQDLGSKPVDIKTFVTAATPNAGHRVKTAGGQLPVGAPLPCYECHNPHGSTRNNASQISDERGANLDTSTDVGARQFCFTCHVASDTGRGWDSEASAYTTPAAGDKIVGLARDAGVLKLPTGVDAHAEGASESCETCHGSSYTEGGYNVHNPSGGGDHHSELSTSTPVSINGVQYTVSCYDCHSVQLSEEHLKTTSSSAANGCASCHPTPRDTLAPWDRTGCVQGGCHTAGTPQAQHADIDTAHDPNPANATCTNGSGCHTSGDLAAIHSSASTTTAGGQTRTSCQVCHAEGVPTTNNCQDCHGDTTSTHYNYAAHTAQPASQTVTISGVEYGPVECADCHQLEIMSSHNGGDCGTCHPSPKNTLAPVWDKSCAQGGCHTALSTRPMHASIDASHAPVAGQTCYDGGCHPQTASQSLAETHKNASAVLGGQTRTSCQVCHWNGTPKSAACADCHADRVDGSHGASQVHLFSAASDANAAAQTGCTNSGAGCHGTETLYNNFSNYHPNSGCTSGACHTSPSQPSFNTNGTHECASCHDGSYTGAPVTAALATQHYVDTTHTASGLTDTVSAGGTVSATCADCHNPVDLGGTDGLAAQHRDTVNGTLTCSACHNANLNVTSVVNTKWQTKQCAECHNVTALPTAVQHGTTAPAVTATTADNCLSAGCHVSNLHEIHKGKAGGAVTSCAIAGCHDTTKQGAKPTKTTCGTNGACHASGDPHPAANATHTAVASSECVSCHAQADVRTLHSAAGCATCHGNAAYPSLPAGKTAECVSCHNGTDVGTHAYSPADPSHYSATLHTPSAPATFTAAYQSLAPKGTIDTLGRECSSCHSESLKAAHSNTSTSTPATADGSVSCVECHTDSSLNSSATVAAKWTAGRCADCHDANSGKTHDAMGTAHVVPAGTCAGTGSSCHNYTDLAQLHNVRQNGGTYKYSSCGDSDPTDPTACHSRVDARPAKFDAANSCGSTSTGCHQEKTPANHGSATAHKFTAASDYSNTSTPVAGCTNSGAGCHGSESTYSNFTSYHPNSGCTSGACHTSPSKPGVTGTGTHECASCHDGSFVNAPQTSPLHNNAGVGHYGETSHTASGLSTVLSAGGTASATCADCHNPVNLNDVDWLYNQHQGLPAPYSDTTCYDCHNKNPQVTGVVTSKWPTKQCSACHNSSVMPGLEQHGSTPPVVAPTAVGVYQSMSCDAAGCHSQGDLHTIHKNAVSCAVAGCHDFSQQAKLPAGTSCGLGNACHNTAEPHTNLSGAHNASTQTLAAPGSSDVTQSATAVNQTFDAASWPTDLVKATSTNATVTVANVGGTQGNVARIGMTTGTAREYAFFTKIVDLTDYSAATLSFNDMTTGLATGDYARVDYSIDGGKTWTQVRNLTTASAWPASPITSSLPVGNVVRIRFGASLNATTKNANWDAISVTGTARQAAALAAGSQVDASCQNNPNGTECHSVSDVRVLHQNVPVQSGSSVCSTTCHKVGVTPTNDCQAAGCHAGVNKAQHLSAQHATSFESTATGRPMAGTGFTSTWCAGCHTSNIQSEHSSLAAYKNTPCSVCHKKSTNSAAPISVTATATAATVSKSAGTASCSDCHENLTASRLHVQRAGIDATPSAQFNSAWSGHRMYDTMPGSRDGAAGTGGPISTGLTSPATVTWSLPGTIGNWLNTPYQSTTMAIRCNDCHGTVSAGTRAHGQSMRINMRPDADESYQTGTLYAGSTANPLNLCSKCHNISVAGLNAVHNQSNHRGSATNGACTLCHSPVAHGSQRPRLLAYTTDPQSYRPTNTSRGVTGFRAHTITNITSVSSSGWLNTDCGAGCNTSTHAAIGATAKWK